MQESVLTSELEDEELDMGSYNHSTVQANLAFLFKKLGKYSVATELSLEIGETASTKFGIQEELKPDVCIYPRRGLSRPYDILKMAEMPLLVIEILSPTQGTYSILKKFEVYFDLGVQSCWLVDPATEMVAVYSSLAHHKIFSTGDVVDEKLTIQIPVAEIFE